MVLRKKMISMAALSIFIASSASLLSITGCSTVNQALGGNSEKEALMNVKWEYGTGALRLAVDADPALNNYDGQAHSVVLAIVQSADPTAFYQPIETPSAALSTLLETGQPTPGLLQVTRYAIEPGKKTAIQLDRAQGAKYVGIIVAYYGIPLTKTAKLFNIPVTVAKKGIVVKDYNASPAVAEIQLKLGPDSILSTGISPVAPKAPATGEQPAPTTTEGILLNGLNPSQ